MKIDIKALTLKKNYTKTSITYIKAGENNNVSRD